MAMSEQQSGGQHTDGAASSDSKSPLQAILARGALDRGDAKDFEEALKNKQQPAERAAELLASRWPDLPRELQMIVVRWKWQERKADSRAKACLRVGAAVAKTDPPSASGLLGEAMKLASTKPDVSAKPARSGTGATPIDLRTTLRKMLVERWLTPLDAAPLFSLRYSHIAREARSEFVSMLGEAVGGEGSGDRIAVVKWLKDQLSKEAPGENRHAVESALKAFQGSSPPSLALSQATSPPAESAKDAPATTTAIPEVPESRGEPRTPLAQVSTVAAPVHPRVPIAEALRVIQAEVRRWSSEDGSELQSLRRKATELEESLKRRTQERDELGTTLGIVRTKHEQLERSVSELSEQHARALRVVESSETEVRQLKQHLVGLEAQHADATKLKEQLEKDLGRSREDKRRDVEYTRDAERAAMAQEIGRTASIHLENMKDLLQLEPSQKQRAALQSCHDELARVFRTSPARSNG
jgi:hypothetical protein